MTPTHTATPTPTRVLTDASSPADQLLRDMAFVLRMTRRVKDEILADVPVRTARRLAAPRRELATA